MKPSLTSLLVSLCALLASDANVLLAEEPLVLISSFAPGETGGVHSFRLDLVSGALEKVASVSNTPNAFYLAVTPDQKFAYSIYAPTFGGADHEQIAAFQLDAAIGTVTPLNRVGTKGSASCYLEIDASGRCLLMANYMTGSVASYSIASDGKLSEPVSFFEHSGSSVNPARQKEPHAHCFVFSPDFKHAYAADLGTDQIFCYDVDSAKATIAKSQQPFVRLPPGSGPRHLTFHPNGKWMFVINELLNTVTQFDYLSDTGMLIERQTIATLPPDFTGISHTADVRVTPNGRFLYGTNRGHDSIAVFRLDDAGTMSLVEIAPSLGKGPQNLAITSDGTTLICANMAGSNVATFRIDSTSGKLTSLASPIDLPGPSCVRILE
jgi:6-phosphogluconolactonase